MMSDPEPLKSIWTLLRECAEMKSYPHGIKTANLFESNGRMPRVRFEESKVPVGKNPDVVRKLAVVKPEIRIRKVLQSGVQ